MASPEVSQGYSVVVIDMFHYMGDDANTTVDGFATLELAREYARRRTRDSLEEQRDASSSAQDLRQRWFMFGEDCQVLNDTYCGARELDYFIAHPATAEERDWVVLEPRPKT